MKNLGLWVALAKLLTTIIGWFQRQAGAAEERVKQKAESDALQQHYDQIDSTELSEPDAFDRLRSRTAPPRPDDA